ncbi:MAG: hypothetical protein NT098_05485 [Candidatus Parcubacteria bacterium]|nr:hypothetical protein [Candidatus Parcubacteria bacterium]
MIDTVCLLIPKSKIAFVAGSGKWDLFSKTADYEKHVRNPNKAEEETGNYFPRLTGYSRRFGQDENIRMEFSAPKLLYLNNLDELEEKDFSALIETLQKQLRIMGVIVEKTVLENASVSSVHYSKNILLEGGYTASYLISEMNKVDLRKSFDFAKTRFVNDGHSLYAHTTAHELVIYDKVADMGKGKKRAVDKDQTLFQMSLFPELKKKEMFEVIRFEIRLNKKAKMNSVFEELGYKKDPSFKDVFKEEISKKVVSDYWRKLMKERSFGIFSIAPSDKDIFQTMCLADTKLKGKRAVYLFGLYMLGRNENGLRQLREIITKRAKVQTWYRMMKDMNRAGELITKNNLRDWAVQIDKGLENFKAYKIKVKFYDDEN